MSRRVLRVVCVTLCFSRGEIILTELLAACRACNSIVEVTVVA